jgi:hypothetical protein
MEKADSTSQALDWIKDRSSEPGYFTWMRFGDRKYMVEEGRLEEFKTMDEKYGPPLEEPDPTPAFGPAVYTRSCRPPKNSAHL